jgi:peptidoglycan/xylan/chitin deacetylase (PgdA/CDA1 family)
MKLLRPLFSALSPAGAHAKLSVLIFHRVLSELDPLFPDELHRQRFDDMCRWLADWFNILPLDVAVTQLKAGTLPSRAACITFDDGYADNCEVAMPILQTYGMTATFFIATGFLDGGRMWNDTIIEAIRGCALPEIDLTSIRLGRHTLDTNARKRAAITTLINGVKYYPPAERIAVSEHVASSALVTPRSNLMMTSQQVRMLRHAGMQVGAHTVSHPILANLTIDQATREIADSKAFLEHLLGERVGLFAYPNGKPHQDYSTDSVEVVRSLDFDVAVNTQWGFADRTSDALEIRRFTPWDKSQLGFGLRLLGNLRRS